MPPPSVAINRALSPSSRLVSLSFSFQFFPILASQPHFLSRIRPHIHSQETKCNLYVTIFYIIAPRTNHHHHPDSAAVTCNHLRTNTPSHPSRTSSAKNPIIDPTSLFFGVCFPVFRVYITTYHVITFITTIFKLFRIFWSLVDHFLLLFFSDVIRWWVDLWTFFLVDCR